MSAREPSAAAKLTKVTLKRTTTATSIGGLTAERSYTPFGVLSRVFYAFHPPAQSVPSAPTRFVEGYAAALVTATTILGLALASAGFSVNAPFWVIGSLACVALIAEKQSVRVTSHTEVSISALPILFAAVVYGPLAAMIVGACALLADFRRPYTRWVVWTASRALTGGLAGLAALLVGPDMSSFGSVFTAVSAAAVVEGVTDSTLVALTATFRRNGSFPGLMRIMGRVHLATVPLHAPVVAVLAYAYVQVSPWTVVLFLIPALASQRLLLLYQEQRCLTDDLRIANGRLERASISFAGALVAALDARDRYTAGHSAAVAIYARDIAARLKLSPELQQLAHLCGLLHDIGKVGLSPSILEKEGPLTPEERKQMEEHSVVGQRILGNVEGYEEIATIVRHHHERIDGNGYPDRLSDDQIPLISRVLCVADAYNAMTSGRPYRTAMAPNVALARLAEGAGSQFDSTIVSCFLEILAEASDVYQRGARSDFALEAQQHPALDGSSAATLAA